MRRDVSTGSTGATWVAPKFSYILTQFQPGGGGSMPTIGMVAPEFCYGYVPVVRLSLKGVLILNDGLTFILPRILYELYNKFFEY